MLLRGGDQSLYFAGVADKSLLLCALVVLARGGTNQRNRREMQEIRLFAVKRRGVRPLP
jgi:hypothetical protein